jgi:hypothetical protein
MHNLPESSTHNQAQPEPNLVPAALEKSSLNFSKEVKFLLIASAIDPLGIPPPFGLIIFQNIQWLKYPPLLFLAPPLNPGDLHISSIDLFSKSEPSIAFLNEGENEDAWQILL